MSGKVDIVGGVVTIAPFPTPHCKCSKRGGVEPVPMPWHLLVDDLGANFGSLRPPYGWATLVVENSEGDKRQYAFCNACLGGSLPPEEKITKSVVESRARRAESLLREQLALERLN